MNTKNQTEAKVYVNCPFCGQLISDQADKCGYCGRCLVCSE